MMKISPSGKSISESKYIDFDVYDLSQITLDSNTGELTVLVPMQVEGKDIGWRVRFCPEAAHKLWVQLGRLQQVLEKAGKGSPPSDIRH